MPEPEYAGLEGEEGGLKEKLAPIIESIQKFGVGKLVFIIIILAALAWFFVLAPKPGSLTVTVQEIDSGKNIEGAEVRLTLPDQKTLTELTEDGSVTFRSVPSKVKLSVEVDPPTTHKRTEENVELSSGEPKSLPIEVGRNADLTLGIEGKDIFLGAGCSTTLPVSVKNNGAEAFQVEFVGDGLTVSSENKLVSPQATELVSVKITAPKETSALTGSLRAKFTKAAVGMSINVGESTEADVSPNTIRERVAPNQQFKQLVTVKNIARTGEVRDLATQITGDIVQYTKAEFTDVKPLKPDEEKILTVVIDVPSTGGKLVGVLLISTSCKTYQVPVELEIQAAG